MLNNMYTMGNLYNASMGLDPLEQQLLGGAMMGAGIHHGLQSADMGIRYWLNQHPTAKVVIQGTVALIIVAGVVVATVAITKKILSNNDGGCAGVNMNSDVSLADINI